MTQVKIDSLWNMPGNGWKCNYYNKFFFFLSTCEKMNFYRFLHANTQTLRMPQSPYHLGRCFIVYIFTQKLYRYAKISVYRNHIFQSVLMGWNIFLKWTIKNSSLKLRRNLVSKNAKAWILIFLANDIYVFSSVQVVSSQNVCFKKNK